MSASRSPTLQPCWVSATARFTETVLLPTPPFPLPTRMTLRTVGTRSALVPLAGDGRTEALNATSTRVPPLASCARTSSSSALRCGLAGVGSSRRTRRALPSSGSTALTIWSSPSVRPDEGSFSPASAFFAVSAMESIADTVRPREGQVAGERRGKMRGGRGRVKAGCGGSLRGDDDDALLSWRAVDDRAHRHDLVRQGRQGNLRDGDLGGGEVAERWGAGAGAEPRRAEDGWDERALGRPPIERPSRRQEAAQRISDPAPHRFALGGVRRLGGTGCAGRSRRQPRAPGRRLGDSRHGEDRGPELGA